jgi:hypothetical protein
MDIVNTNGDFCRKAESDKTPVWFLANAQKPQKTA